MPEPDDPDIPKWEKEDFVDVIGRAYHRDKKKRKVRQASGWKVTGGGKDFIRKSAKDGRIMLIIFGGVHPKVYNFANKKQENRLFHELMQAANVSRKVDSRYPKSYRFSPCRYNLGKENGGWNYVGKG